MTHGRITSVPTLDWRGDTLTAAVLATDTVLKIGDTADFDGEPDEDSLLVLADSTTPIRYTAVDEDAATVTLATAVGTAYEAGVPVTIWDRSVTGGGAPVREYEAPVMTDRGPVPAILPHGLVPTAGVDLLVGASVVLGVDEDGRDVVEEVLGREAQISGRAVWNPHAKRAINAITVPSVPATSPVAITSFTDVEVDGFAVTASGLVVQEPGWYHPQAKVAWLPNESNRRWVFIYLDGVEIARDAANAEGAGVATFLSASTSKRLEVGQVLTMAVAQNSGAGLGVSVNVDQSHLSVYRISV